MLREERRRERSSVVTREAREKRLETKTFRSNSQPIDLSTIEEDEAISAEGFHLIFIFSGSEIRGEGDTNVELPAKEGSNREKRGEEEVQ